MRLVTYRYDGVTEVGSLEADDRTLTRLLDLGRVTGGKQDADGVGGRGVDLLGRESTPVIRSQYFLRGRVSRARFGARSGRHSRNKEKQEYGGGNSC